MFFYTDATAATSRELLIAAHTIFLGGKNMPLENLSDAKQQSAPSWQSDSPNIDYGTKDEWAQASAILSESIAPTGTIGEQLRAFANAEHLMGSALQQFANDGFELVDKDKNEAGSRETS
jgi:hypothetical protein